MFRWTINPSTSYAAIGFGLVIALPQGSLPIDNVPHRSLQINLVRCFSILQGYCFELPYTEYYLDRKFVTGSFARDSPKRHRRHLLHLSIYTLIIPSKLVYCDPVGITSFPLIPCTLKAVDFLKFWRRFLDLHNLVLVQYLT